MGRKRTESNISFTKQSHFVKLRLPQVFWEKKLHIEFPYLLQIKHDLYIKVRVYELTIINWFNCNKRWRIYTLNKWKRRPWFIILPSLTKELRLTHPVNVSSLWSSHNRYISQPKSWTKPILNYCWARCVFAPGSFFIRSEI